MESLDQLSLAAIPPKLRPNFRDIYSLLLWAYCFAQYMYVAVLGESHPYLVKLRLAYCVY